MRNTAASFLTWVSYAALAIATIHGTLLVVMKAHADYGWLGVVVVIAVGIPLFWLLPIVGWFFLPAAQMVWLCVFLAAALLARSGAAALDNKAAT